MKKIDKENLLVTEKAILDFAEKNRLSPREKDLLMLVCCGLESNEELARELGITIGTTRRMAHDIYAKTRTSSKFELLRSIIRNPCPKNP